MTPDFRTKKQKKTAKMQRKPPGASSFLQKGSSHHEWRVRRGIGGRVERETGKKIRDGGGAYGLTLMTTPVCLCKCRQRARKELLTENRAGRARSRAAAGRKEGKFWVGKDQDWRGSRRREA